MPLIKAELKNLPDGSQGRVYPFHISYEGMEKIIICRDDDDYDRFVKCMAVCARRKNVIIIIYAVVSNHAHIAILAKSYSEAYDYAYELKRVYSQMFAYKYKISKSLRKAGVDVEYLDSDWYLRNALAYIPRNAYDNGAESIKNYKWSGYRAMFTKGEANVPVKKVSLLTKREKESIMHTGDDLPDVKWLLNPDYELEPVSFCDYDYLEKTFGYSEAFFCKCIGEVNVSEMTHKLVISPRVRKNDAEMMTDVEALAEKWYSQKIENLSSEHKARLLQYVKRTMKTSIPQLARIFGLERQVIEKLL